MLLSLTTSRYDLFKPPCPTMIHVPYLFAGEAKTGRENKIAKELRLSLTNRTYVL